MDVHYVLRDKTYEFSSLQEQNESCINILYGTAQKGISDRRESAEMLSLTFLWNMFSDIRSYEKHVTK
jgi:hypothetical protein